MAKDLMIPKKELCLIIEAKEKYGSVSKMISTVKNEVLRLNQFGGFGGRDGADTLDRAIRVIDKKFHSLYHKYSHSYPRP